MTVLSPMLISPPLMMTTTTTMLIMPRTPRGRKRQQQWRWPASLYDWKLHYYPLLLRVYDRRLDWWYYRPQLRMSLWNDSQGVRIVVEMKDAARKEFAGDRRRLLLRRGSCSESLALIGTTTYKQQGGCECRYLSRECCSDVCVARGSSDTTALFMAGRKKVPIPTWPYVELLAGRKIVFIPMYVRNRIIRTVTYTWRMNQPNTYYTLVPTHLQP